MSRRQPRSLEWGLTIIELMVTLVITGVLVAIAVPSMYEFIIRKRVEGAADELMTDLRYARTMQMANNKRVTVKFSADASMSCYVVYEYTTFGTCDCRNTDTPVCSTASVNVPQEYKTVRHPVSRKVSVQPISTSLSEVTLDMITGLPLNEDTLTIAITAPQGGEVRVSTNAAFRPQACSQSGHESAYTACPP